MRLLVAFLYETILRSDLCDIKLYYGRHKDYYTPCSMQLDGGDLTKMHTYLCEHRWRIIETRGGPFPLVVVQFQAK